MKYRPKVKIMIEEKLKYFVIAKELNKKHHNELISKELYFRGNINSFSLVSVSSEFAETGKSRLKKIESGDEAIKLILSTLKKPKRKTPEKQLQAWILKFAMNNDLQLPFGNCRLITSELAFPTEKRKKGYVNDILALDNENSFVIIELKSFRNNEVKIQAREFEEEVVNKNKRFFQDLVYLVLGEKWNGKVKKVSVWPYRPGNLKKQKYLDVEELNYTQQENNYSFQ